MRYFSVIAGIIILLFGYIICSRCWLYYSNQYEYIKWYIPSNIAFRIPKAHRNLDRQNTWYGYFLEPGASWGYIIEKCLFTREIDGSNSELEIYKNIISSKYPDYKKQFTLIEITRIDSRNGYINLLNNNNLDQGSLEFRIEP